jgi:peptide/nickel transport system ATP-binding protein
VLDVRDLELRFSMYARGLRKAELRVITSLSLDVRRGEIVAVVGSSGSGKSLLAHAIFGILPSNASVGGSIYYEGEELTPEMQRRYRGVEFALIPQSVACLDPLMRVDRQVMGTRGDRESQRRAFARYGLAPEVGRMFPFRLSGGMARRVLVSTAVCPPPKLIVADEPTPGLGIEPAMETMRHFREIADDGAAILLITHDIDAALEIADRIAVFYAGTTVEIAPAEDFRSGGEALRHPYSRAFADALPQNAFRPIPGAQPYAGALPSGCLFADRCPLRSDGCGGDIGMRDVRGGKVRCVHAT